MDWARAARPLRQAQLALLLHLAAAAVAAGALAALYARGLVFDYRAGWDSTFLDADAVHRWLSLLLAPALAIVGGTLPEPAQLELLRFSSGSAGENGARWIHWYAVTTALVLAPRLLLALAALLRIRRWRRRFELPLDDRYFRRLFQWLAHSRDQTSHLALVAPFGLKSGAGRRAALAAAVDAEFGPGLQLEVLPNLQPGDDDELPDDWPRAPGQQGQIDLLLPLFALSATPERETHGRFIATVLRRAGNIDGRPRCRVMIDESGLRNRLAGAGLDARLGERRSAWRKLVGGCDAGEPLFVDLDHRDPNAEKR